MIQPSWITTFNSIVSYGFDSTGLWFSGNANSETGEIYPVQTNFDISENQTTTVIFTFIHDSECADQGVCIFSSNIDPIWIWEGPHESRIAFQMNCITPEISGLTEFNSVGEEGPFLQDGQTYTGKLVYNPTNGTVTGEIYQGTSATGEPYISLTIEESLPGPYRVGFFADQDGTEDVEFIKSYFTYISVNNYKSNESVVGCSTVCRNDNIKGFSCFKQTGCKCCEMKYVQIGTSGGWIPSITICNQNL